MTKFTLDNYLIWNRLHVGVLIIGWFYAISSVFTILYLIGMIMLFSEISSRIADTDLHNRIIPHLTPYIVILVVNLITVVPNIFVIIGVEKRNGKYFIPWLIIGMLQVIFGVIVYGYILPMSPSIVYFMTLAIIFYGYHWLVVFSLCMKYMNKDESNLNHVSLHNRMEV